MERGAIYTRLSKNRYGESDNCAIQKAEAMDYALDRDVTVTDELCFEDDDRSASKFSKKPRPDYARLLQAISANQVDVVYATEMSRLYRRMEELLELIRLAERTTLKRIETTDGQVFLLHTAEGIHAAISQVNNSQLESGKISSRGKRKKRAQAKLGLPGGGSRSFGYTKDHMHIVDEEAQIIKDLAARFLAGASIASLTKDINERGILTTRGNPWVRNRLTSMLVNPRYIGVRVHRDEQYPAQWPAILQPETQEQIRLELRSRMANRERRGGPRRYLLIGFAVCGLCGNKLTCSQHRRDSTRKLKATYTCRAKDNHEIKVGCDHISRNGEALEHFVTQAVMYRLDSDGLAQTISAMSEDKSRLSELMTEVEVRTKRLNDLTDDYASGLLDRIQYSRAKSVARDTLETAQALLNKELQTRTVVSLPVAQTLRETWDKADLEWRRALIGMMIDKVVVNKQVKRPVYLNLGRFDIKSVEIVWAR